MFYLYLFPFWVSSECDEEVWFSKFANKHHAILVLLSIPPGAACDGWWENDFVTGPL